MDVKGLGATGYLRDYGAKSRKSVPGKSYLEKTENKNVLEKVTPSKQISIEDIYDKMKQGNKEIEKAKTDTDIIVKPDGSRVLVVTMSVGGMETTMSLEISKPTDLPNETGKNEDDVSQMPDREVLCEGIEYEADEA